MSGLPPGADAPRTDYYIRIENSGNPFFNGRVHWVARYTNGARGWNVTPYYAEPFATLTHTKSVMRQVARRQDTKDAKITIVAVTYQATVRTAYPECALDALARVV